MSADWKSQLGFVAICFGMLLSACASADQAGDSVEIAAAPTLTDTPDPTATTANTPTPTEAPPSAMPTITPTDEPAFPVRAGEIIYMVGHSQLKAIAPDGQHDRVLMAFGSMQDVPHAISPDFRYLAMSGSHAVSILDLQTGEMVTVKSAGGSPMGIDWSPDSQTIFFISLGDGFSLQKGSLLPDSPAEVLIPNLFESNDVQREFMGVVDDAHLLLNKTDTSGSGPVFSVILLDWQTGAETVISSDYQVRSISPDRTRVVLNRRDETSYAGAGVLRAFTRLLRDL